MNPKILSEKSQAKNKSGMTDFTRYPRGSKTNLQGQKDVR